MHRSQRGFTLVELVVVVALIAIASGLATLALRDASANALEQEAARLAALLESARAESRAAGVTVRWVPVGPDPGPAGFRFLGLGPGISMPANWLHDGVVASVIGGTSLTLGPEPLIAPQRLVLRLDERSLVLATDGLGPFQVANP